LRILPDVLSTKIPTRDLPDSFKLSVSDCVKVFWQIKEVRGFEISPPPPPWFDSPSGPRPPHCLVSAITLRSTTLGRTLGEWSARSRDLYLTKYDTHNTQTSMPSAGFEPTIPTSQRTQTDALEGAATRTGFELCWLLWDVGGVYSINNRPYTKDLWWPWTIMYTEIKWCSNGLNRRKKHKTETCWTPWTEQCKFRGPHGKRQSEIMNWVIQTARADSFPNPCVLSPLAVGTSVQIDLDPDRSLFSLDSTKIKAWRPLAEWHREPWQQRLKLVIVEMVVMHWKQRHTECCLYCYAVCAQSP